MISKEDYVRHMASVWNSSKIRAEYMASKQNNPFLMVEGFVDAVLAQRMALRKKIHPIAVSHLQFSKELDDYIVELSTFHNRGKSFLIRGFHEGRFKDSFGLVDMDTDVNKTQLEGLEGKVIDSSNSMTLIGKSIGNVARFVTMFCSHLYDLGMLTSKQNISIREDAGMIALCVKAKSMQRFLGIKQTVFDSKFRCITSFVCVTDIHDELTGQLQTGLNYVNDHDLEDVLISVLSFIRTSAVRSRLRQFIFNLPPEKMPNFSITDGRIHWC